MNIRTLSITALIAACISTGAASAGQHLEMHSAVVVESGEPREPDDLVILGQNFDNGGDVQLTLGGTPLRMTRQSDSVIVASIPVDVIPGSYQLIAWTGGGSIRIDSMDVTIGAAGPAGSDGSDCSVTQGRGGATIDCTDGTSAFISDGVDGTPGKDGADGLPGQDGTDGQDGTSCTVVQGDGSATISCTDGTMATVMNGTDGAPGASGPIGPQGEPGPGIEIAGLRCPADHLLVGFEPDGGLACESFEPVDPTPDFSCVVNFDGGQIADNLLAAATPVYEALAGIPLSFVTTQEDTPEEEVLLDFLLVLYELKFDSMQPEGPLAVTSLLAETSAEEACEDEIVTTLDYGTIAVAGTYEITVDQIGTFSGDFAVTFSGRSYALVSDLESPDITGPTMTALLDRSILSTSAGRGSQGSIEASVSNPEAFEAIPNDPATVNYPLVLELLESHLVRVADEEVAPQSFSSPVLAVSDIVDALPPPVAIEVMP